MTRSEMLSRMSSQEYELWRALYQLEPWGPKVRDTQLAQISSILWTANTKKGKTYQPEAMMLSDTSGEGDPETLVENIAAINQLMGGKDKRNDG